MARAGGGLVPQSTKPLARARSQSAGGTQEHQQGLPSPGPLVRQRSQGPPVGGLVRQKSTRPQRKCRSMTDVFERQKKACFPKAPDLDLAEPPELFGAAASSSIGSPIGLVSPTGAAGGSRVMERDDMIFAGLFDGHGGDGCARFLQQQFYRNLSREISYRCIQDLHSKACSANAAPIE